MDLSELPAALTAAGGRVAELPAELDPEAAALVLAQATPPRRTGALAASGRVEASSVMFGGGVVDYAPEVEAASPFLAPALVKALPAVLHLAAAKLADATDL